MCEEDSYLLELVRYIHLNCVRARLVRDIEELDRYRWSGHSVLMGKQDRSWQAREEVLSYFGRREGIARARYRQYVLDGIPLGRREDLTAGDRKGKGEGLGRITEGRGDSRILGSGEFVEKMLAEEEKVVEKRGVLKRKGIGVEDLINLVGKRYGVTGEEITGASQRWVVSTARSVFCCMAAKELGWTGRELSRLLNVTPAAIHYAVARGERILTDNKEVEEGLNKDLIYLTTSPSAPPYFDRVQA